MKFTVVWTQAAEDALTQLWLDADSAVREQISRASDEIDSILSKSADTAGESRETEFQRMLIVMPLGISYKVKPLDRIASIASVHLIPALD
jgi:hypothetical protein